MKKTILYAVVTAALTAAAAIAIVGCNGDLGSDNPKMEDFLDKFHYNTKKKVKQFTITYNGNGNDTGNAPIDNYSPYDSGTSVPVLGKNTLWKRGYEFARWDTRANGDGDSYEPTDRITLFKNDTLYAQWNDISGVIFNVTVDTRPIIGTGASGSGDYTVGTSVRINAGTTPNDCWQFQRWTSNDVDFANANDLRTTFIMPEHDVIVTAEFVASGCETSSFTDSRDGKTYGMVKIGEQTWMAQNLNREMDSSWCYDNSVDNCNRYGRLYNWNAAMAACPMDWHLPTKQEWDDLLLAVGGSDIAGKKLKSTSGWDNNGNGTDEFGFSALPGGSYYGGRFYSISNWGFWWTATEKSGSSGVYWRSMLYLNYVDGYEDDTEKNQGYSVRCVKND